MWTIRNCKVFLYFVQSIVLYQFHWLLHYIIVSIIYLIYVDDFWNYVIKSKLSFLSNNKQIQMANTCFYRMDFGLRATFEKNVMVLDKMVLSFHKWLLIKYYLNALVKSDILNWVHHSSRCAKCFHLFLSLYMYSVHI